jgi:hypothetical protein
MNAVTKALGTTLLLLSVTSAAQAGEPGPGLRCRAESEKLAGRPAAAFDKNSRGPRKLHAEPLDLVAQADGRQGTGIWLGEVLINQEGKVQTVWTIRSPRFEPAWPGFDAIVARNLEQSLYQPTVVDGEATPVCLVVSVLIDYRR